jgi:acetyltransferase-like isoleucine patch superfamily enzyme
MMKQIKTKIRRLQMSPRLLHLRYRGVLLGKDVKVYGRLHVSNAQGSKILLGDNVVLNADMDRNSLEARGPVVLKTLNSGAVITIGPDSGLTSATISSAIRVVVGARVLIGAGVMITDSDHHVVRPEAGLARRFLGLPIASESDSIVVEDDVFIGARSIVLKGVRIGAGTVVGAGSVVTRSIPAGVIAGGNPCRVLKSLNG